MKVQRYHNKSRQTTIYQLQTFTQRWDMLHENFTYLLDHLFGSLLWSNVQQRTKALNVKWMAICTMEEFEGQAADDATGLNLKWEVYKGRLEELKKHNTFNPFSIGTQVFRVSLFIIIRPYTSQIFLWRYSWYYFVSYLVHTVKEELDLNLLTS